jgi:hypothetical protein
MEEIEVDGGEKMVDFDLYKSVVGNDDDYEENQEKVNTDLTSKLKKRKIDGYRGI